MDDQGPLLLTDAERAVLTRWRWRSLRRHLVALASYGVLVLLIASVTKTDLLSLLTTLNNPTSRAGWGGVLSIPFMIYSAFPLAVLIKWAVIDARFRRDLAEGLASFHGTVSPTPVLSCGWIVRSAVQEIYLTPPYTAPSTIPPAEVPRPLKLRVGLTDRYRLPSFTYSDCTYFPHTKILYQVDGVICDRRPRLSTLNF